VHLSDRVNAETAEYTDWIILYVALCTSNERDLFSFPAKMLISGALNKRDADNKIAAVHLDRWGDIGFKVVRFSDLHERRKAVALEGLKVFYGNRRRTPSQGALCERRCRFTVFLLFDKALEMSRKRSYLPFQDAARGTRRNRKRKLIGKGGELVDLGCEGEPLKIGGGVIALGENGRKARGSRVG